MDETERDTAAANAGNGAVPPTTNATPAPPAAPPGVKLVDPFAHYAQLEGGEAFFDGDYVKLDQDTGWIRGQGKAPIGATEAFVAKMHEARHGHIKFAKSDGESVKHRTRNPILRF
jgi:hypothetical protein